MRREALERDDHECVLCGATPDDTGRNPDVHHIVPVRWFIESDDHEKIDAHALDNVVSLWVSRHRNADHDNVSEQCLRARIDTETEPSQSEE